MYGRIRRRMFLLSLAYSALLVAAAVGWMAIGAPYPGEGLTFPLNVLGLSATLFLMFEVVTLPVAVITGYRLPKNFGLSVQTFGGWLADRLKSLGISFVIGLPATVAVYGLMTISPAWWWLWASILAILLTVVLANLAPVLLLPLFYKLEPIDDVALTQRLERLAAGSGAKVRGVYKMAFSAKGTGANAMLMGWGNTRRIVLSDTLLDRYTPEEVEVVLAHELGHHVHRDIPKLISLQAALLAASFGAAQVALTAVGPTLGVSSVADPRGMPLLASAVGLISVLAMPASNALSRTVERAADAYALRRTRLIESFVVAMDKLTDQNLAEAAPPKWAEVLFASHPTHEQRVAFARRFEQHAT